MGISKVYHPVYGVNFVEVWTAGGWRRCSFLTDTFRRLQRYLAVDHLARHGYATPVSDMWERAARTWTLQLPPFAVTNFLHTTAFYGPPDEVRVVRPYTTG